MSTQVRLTVRELELLPDRLDDTRYELVDGDLHVAPQPSWEHQFVASRIWAALQDWSDKRDAGTAVTAPALILSPEDVVAPDVVWVSTANEEAVFGDDGKLYAAPELVVEVLSPGTTNAKRDQELKLTLYSRYGVREYWIVDWQHQAIRVYRRHEASLALNITLQTGDELSSPLLPDFRLPLAAIWNWRRRRRP